MNRLKELREKQGLTLDDIEEQTGIKRATFSRYENGKSEPKLETWEFLAVFFGVSVHFLQGEPDYFEEAKLTSQSYSDDIAFGFDDDYTTKEDEEFYFLAFKDLEDLSNVLPKLNYLQTLEIKKTLENTYFGDEFEEQKDLSDEDTKLIDKHKKVVFAYKNHALKLARDLVENNKKDFQNLIQKNLYAQTLKKLLQRDDVVDEDEEFNITYKNELDLVYYLHLVQDNLLSIKRDKISNAVSALKDLLGDEDVVISDELKEYFNKIHDIDN